MKGAGQMEKLGNQSVITKQYQKRSKTRRKRMRKDKD